MIRCRRFHAFDLEAQKNVINWSSEEAPKEFDWPFRCRWSLQSVRPSICEVKTISGCKLIATLQCRIALYLTDKFDRSVRRECLAEEVRERVDQQRRGWHRWRHDWLCQQQRTATDKAKMVTGTMKHNMMIMWSRSGSREGNIAMVMLWLRPAVAKCRRLA